MVYILIVQDREQPGAQIRSFLPKMQFAESAGQAILYKIIGGDDVARQSPRVAPKARDFGFDLPVSVGHSRSSRCDHRPDRPIRTRRSVGVGRNPMMSGQPVFCKIL